VNTASISSWLCGIRLAVKARSPAEPDCIHSDNLALFTLFEFLIPDPVDLAVTRSGMNFSTLSRFSGLMSRCAGDECTVFSLHRAYSRGVHEGWPSCRLLKAATYIT
jgi:hypothetical protein